MTARTRWLALLLVALIGPGCTGVLGEGSTPRTRIPLPDAGTIPPGTRPTPPPRERGDAGSDPADADTAGPFDPGMDMCGDVRLTELIYYGTLEPTYLPLTPGQIMAVADLNGCSGLLINPSWVLTAEHCGVRRGSRVCFGSDPADADVCFNAVAAYDGPSGGDIALLDLGESVLDRLPGITPIPILMEDVTAAWEGRTAEAAGYGQMETGYSGTRKFTAEPIYNVWSDMLTIDGEGRHGVCFGDSGGPVMVIASDGTVRTAGVLSNGDSSCVGRDNFTRVDPYRDWVIGLAGAPTPPMGGACGDLDTLGRCMDGRAIWCDADDTLATELCDSGRTCGWDPAEPGFRCIRGADPCGGLDRHGVCAGDIARWCEDGMVRQRDCGACEETCGIVAEVGGAYCQPDACMGVDYHGRCDGDVVVYCKEGALRRVDCSERGQRCGWVDDELGYFCH